MPSERTAAVADFFEVEIHTVTVWPAFSTQR